MNPWIINIILRILGEYFDPAMIEELKDKFAEWLWSQVQNPETKVDDTLFGIFCVIMGLDAEKYKS